MKLLLLLSMCDPQELIDGFASNLIEAQPTDAYEFGNDSMSFASLPCHIVDSSELALARAPTRTPCTLPHILT